MRIVLACEPNGFGPVSKLTAIARLLTGHERIFVGDAGAYAYARRNSDCYEAFLTTEEFHASPQAWKDADMAACVMEPDILFELLQADIPVYLFDSLLEFWVLPDGLGPLADAARAMPRMDATAQRDAFHRFTIHERKVLAHMLATKSFAQNYPGVPERLRELADHGFADIHMLGSIIDASTRGDVSLHPKVDERWSMLVNLGGVQNFAIDYFRNDYAIDLVERWARHFLATNPDCGEIRICCGRYGAPETEPVADGVLIREFASHQHFIALLQRADVVLSAAGRTTIHEAIHLGQIPILLPEQHQNQYCNMNALRSTSLGRFMVTLDDVMGPAEDAVTDEAGTQNIIARTRDALLDEAHFGRFCALVTDQLSAMRNLNAVERRSVISEMRAEFSGPDFAAAVYGLVETEVGPARRAQSAG